MIKVSPKFTKDQILEVFSEEDLFKIYCSNFKEIDCPFCSDLRKDKNPSCRISYLTNGLRYKDFGTDIPATDVWGYLQMKFNNIPFVQVINRVGKELLTEKNISLINYSKQTSSSKHITKQEPTVIKVSKRNWFTIDKNYWLGNYAIPLNVLKEYKVFPIDRLWMNAQSYAVDSLAYSYDYYIHNGIFRRKIYQPKSKLYKWLSNVDDTIVQGIENIPKVAPLLIVSSSLKDVMCWNVLGYPAVAPNNERTWIPESVWNKFKQRYARIIIFFDNDETGISSAKAFSSKYQIEYKHVPLAEKSEVKNVSDFIKEYSKEEALKQVNLWISI